MTLCVLDATIPKRLACVLCSISSFLRRFMSEAYCFMHGHVFCALFLDLEVAHTGHRLPSKPCGTATAARKLVEWALIVPEVNRRARVIARGGDDGTACVAASW